MNLQSFAREQLTSWATKSPDSQALADSQSSLTFAELLHSVSSRGLRIRDKISLNNGNPLPILVDHSVDSAVNVLSCIMAGIPCCPIDSRTPPHRLEKILVTLGSHLMVTEGGSVDSINANESTPRRNDPQPPRAPLVMLSSGSAGEPKAVVLPQEAALARIIAFGKRLEKSGANPRILAVSPFHFIAGFLDMLAVFFGASVTLHNPSSAHPSQIIELLRKRDITQLTITPSVARLVSLSVTTDFPTLENLRVLALMGDVARFEQITGLASVMRPTAVIRQIFGASETTPTFVFERSVKNINEHGQVPLGEMADPDNTHLEKIDNGLFEIWRKGPIISHYLNSELLNEKHFTTDRDGVRWWKSGDLIRQDDFGDWYFHSRIDDTVKIRGILASPTESQTLLAYHPDIQAAVVLVDQKNGRNRFIAHVQLSPGSSVTRDDIHEYLELGLPEFLIPSRVITHEQLPLNNRGKPDRDTLRSFH